MSGESGGSIYIPINAATLPVVGVVMASRALVAGLSSAADTAFAYEKKKREKRKKERLRRSGLKEAVGAFHVEAERTLLEQEQQSRLASEQMYQELEQSRQRVLAETEKMDPEGYLEYMNSLNRAGEELSGQFQKIRDDLTKQYHTAVRESMDRITKEVGRVYLLNLEELKKWKEEQNAGREQAELLAQDYLAEAESIVLDLSEEFEGERYQAGALSLLKEQLKEAKAQYEAGNYQAALAVAKDIFLSAVEAIYKADCKRQEWEYYHKCALAAANELYTSMEEQAVITQEIKEQTEKQLGKELPDEIVGISVGEYTEQMENGKTRYGMLQERIRELKEYLESEQVKQADTKQLKEYLTLFHTQLYPEVSRTIFQGILTMSNAFARQDISEEIIDFFEEHNFSFTGYSYDGNEHKGALHIGLENEISGEEIIVTLAPQMLAGNVSTRVEIDQLMGEETNEERRQFYRTSVEQVVTEKTPCARIRLECNSKYRNRFSNREELREKIKA